MEQIKSNDGTKIAFERSGTGPPLILVHGTSASHTRWAPVVPALGEHFTVYAIDRRGRGESGDNPEYTLQREFEDVASLVNSLPEPANVLGHSFGGTCVLGAALLTRNIQRLVLYEPALAVPGRPFDSPEMIRQLEDLLATGDREAVVTKFIKDVVKMPDSEFEMYRKLPAWPARVAAAHTLAREMRAVEEFEFVPELFESVTYPTLILEGGDSPAFMRVSNQNVAQALPNSRIYDFTGQQHIVMDTAPDLFVNEVVTWLAEDPKES